MDVFLFPFWNFLKRIKSYIRSGNYRNRLCFSGLFGSNNFLYCSFPTIIYRSVSDMPVKKIMYHQLYVLTSKSLYLSASLLNVSLQEITSAILRFYQQLQL